MLVHRRQTSRRQMPPQTTAPPARLPPAPALLHLALPLLLLLLAAAEPAPAAAEPTALLPAHRRSLLQPGPLVTLTNAACDAPIRLFSAYPMGGWTPGDASGAGCCTNKTRAAATGTCVEELTEHRTPALSTQYENSDTTFVALNETVQSCWYTNPALRDATSPVLVRVQSDSSIVPSLQTETGAPPPMGAAAASAESTGGIPC